MKRPTRTISIIVSLIASLAPVADSQADEKAKSESGHSVAERLVTWALEAEVAGDARTREKHLRMALEAAPESGAPNWHLGRIAKEGRWLSPAEVHAHAAADAALAEYETQRLAARNAKDGDLRLARWCTKHGMTDRAKVHYRRVFASGVADERIAEEAAKALDLRFVDGAWRSDTEIAQTKKRAEFIQAAVEEWRPKLEKHYERMTSGKAKAASAARQSLLEIDDPRVVIALDSFLANGDDAFGKAGIELLSRFREFEASAVLVRFAVLSPSPISREAATVALQTRPLHHTAPLLINALADPVKSRYEIRHDNVGSVSYEHLLLMEGAGSNLALAYGHRFETRYYHASVEDRPYNADDFWLDGRRNLLSPRAAAQAIDDLVNATNVEKAVSHYNEWADHTNAPIFAALEGMTGADLPRDPAAWRKWWLDQNEIFSPPPTVFLFQQQKEVDHSGRYRYSCFQPGVKVWTEKGPAPIELVQVGDRVYSQDPQSGELALKLVLETTVGPPSAPLLRITIAGEDLFPTLGHDMWKVGGGWRMAKELAVGDRVHGVSGGLPVESLERLPPPQLVHNLIVDDFHTYFVGERGVLVHDFTFRHPTTAIAPGLVTANR